MRAYGSLEAGPSKRTTPKGRIGATILDTSQNKDILRFFPEMATRKLHNHLIDTYLETKLSGNQHKATKHATRALFAEGINQRRVPSLTSSAFSRTKKSI